MMRSRHLPHIAHKIAPLDDTINLETETAASRIQSVHRGRNIRNQFIKIKVGALSSLLPSLRDDIIALKAQYSSLQLEVSKMATHKTGSLPPLVRPATVKGADNSSTPIVMLPFDMQSMQEIEKGDKENTDDMFVMGEEAEEASEHGYNLSSSMWDVSLLFGIEAVGDAGSIYGALLLFINIAIQFVFAFIVSTTFTQPTFSEKTILGSAFMDELSEASLASRICNNDAALELSSYQATSHQFLSAYLRDGGALMCALTVTMWLLTVAKEITVLSNFWRALSCIPSAKITKLSAAGNSLATISDERRFMVRCVHACRLAVVVCLGYAGTAWLVNTVSVTDLILNAVALEFVLCVDEIIFEALAPRRLVCALDSFSQVQLPFPAPREWRGLDVQSCTIFFAVLAALLTVWFLMISPFVVNLGLADNALCAGRHDFVYTIGTPIWSGSKPFTFIVHDADLSKAKSAGSGVWKLDQDTALFEEEAYTMTFARSVIDGIVQGFGTELFSENSTSGCGEDVLFNVYNQSRTFPKCKFEEGGVCLVTFCEARYYVGLVNLEGEVLRDFTSSENSCCVAGQIKSPNIFGGRLSLNGFETETVSTSIEIWNPGCVDMLGELPTNSNLNDVIVHSFMNLLAGALGDALSGTCGLCPAHTPFCYMDTCIAVNCSDVEEYCLEDNTAGVRVRQVCPGTCGCSNPSAKLVLSGPEYGCPATCDQQAAYTHAVTTSSCSNAGKESEEMLEYVDEVTRISAEWPSYWSEYWTGFPKKEFTESGCAAVSWYLSASTPMDFCSFGGMVWPIKPVTHLCRIECGCIDNPEQWGCPKFCGNRGDDTVTDDTSYSYSYHSFSFALPP